MRVQELLATGCMAVMFGLVSGQTTTTSQAPGETPAPEEPPPEEFVPDPCQLPEPPWFCNPGDALPKESAFAVYADPETGFTFGQYDVQMYSADDARLYFRVAVPDPPTANNDVVVQFSAPNSVGWAALAWGGVMLDNPLTVAWPNCSNVVISSRWATNRAIPVAYAGATYELLEVGTHVNETHWQFTARCIGCRTWKSADGTAKAVDVASTGYNIGWAYGKLQVDDPAHNMSTFKAHDTTGSYAHDFTLTTGNKDFAGQIAKVRKNTAPVAALPADAPCKFKWIPPDNAIIVTEKITVTVATQTVTASCSPNSAVATTTPRPTATLVVGTAPTATVYVTVQPTTILVP